MNTSSRLKNQIENFSDSELNKLGIKLKSEAMQELQKARMNLNEAIDSITSNSLLTNSNTNSLTKRLGGRF